MTNLSDWESAVDRAIRKAMEEGQFANLPGEGKPLNLEDDPNTPDDMQMAYKILRENDLAPDWIIEGRELDTVYAGLLERLRAAFRAYQTADDERRIQAEAQWRAAQQDLSETAARLNRKITTYNLKVPPGIRHKPLLNIQREINRLLQDG